MVGEVRPTKKGEPYEYRNQPSRRCWQQYSKQIADKHDRPSGGLSHCAELIVPAGTVAKSPGRKPDASRPLQQIAGLGNGCLQIHIFLIKQQRSGRCNRVMSQRLEMDVPEATISVGDYSLPLRIAAIRRGLRRPCITAITHKGFSSGA